LLERPRIGERDALRTGDLTAALEDALKETGSRCRVGIGALAQVETADHHVIRLETHVDAQHANGALDRQARADQSAKIEELGGREAILARGAFGYSPVPGTKAVYAT